MMCVPIITKVTLQRTIWNLTGQISSLSSAGRAFFYQILGFLCYSQGRLEEAEKVLQQSLEAGLEGRASEAAADTSMALGDVYAKQEQYDLSEPVYQKAIAIYAKLYGGRRLPLSVRISAISICLSEPG